MPNTASSPRDGAVRHACGATLAASGIRVAYRLPGGALLEVLDIDRLDIAAGGCVAIQGPSGSGKTSLAHVLAGIERPLAGSVAWEGRDITALPEAARDRWRHRHVGLVFQQFHLFPALSALENVLLPARFAHVTLPTALVERARALLGTVGVRLAGDVRLMSRGEMQRVAVARALLFAPPVLIADEPTASLDAGSARGVADLIFAACAESGATLIVITHDAALAGRCARVVTLQAGRLHEAGEAAPREAAAE
jgi:putative ABC transport system ATP-binding protein